MAIIIDSIRCPQNHRCPLIKLCPVQAITQEGYALPVIDNKKCIECGKCVNKCPMGAALKIED
ncbi:MAG: 4Fe-4S dicluster domain-containing protein [Muribaculaceae bacterium]